MPRKTFTAGEVLAAGDVNTFLMDQSVMTFADSAARGSAIGTAIAQEGMLTYLEDTDAYEYWDGSAFTSLVSTSGGAATNAIINGAFEINQRNFSSSTAGGYGFDRFNNVVVGDGTATFSAQTFTPGSGPTGYESARHLRIVTTGQTTANTITRIEQGIEDARTFAGQTITVSFFAKVASGTPSVALEIARSYGSGGSPSATEDLVGGKVSLTGGTTWTRYSITFDVPSVSGKTFGTTANTSSLISRLWVSAGSNFNARTDSLGIQSNTFDIWGVQVEAGSTATEFRRNANSLQGELAACQRYYVRFASIAAFADICTSGAIFSSTSGESWTTLPVPMRVNPTSIDFSTLSAVDTAGTRYTISNATLNSVSSNTVGHITFTSSGMTAGRFAWLQNNNSTTAFLGFSAEL